MNNNPVDPRRLELLLLLSRLGSMREVADETGLATSTVSQQISALARQVGTPLIEQQGRGVRLTSAGRRLAEHAVTILATMEAARRDLDPEGEPAGLLRVAGFTTGVRRALLPVAAELRANHPKVRLRIYEHDPPEALALLTADKIDLALTYDYNLAPATVDDALEARPLWPVSWGLAVPDGDARPLRPASDSEIDIDSLTVFRHFRDHDWIVNSRNTADEQVVRVLAAMAGHQPRIAHHADSLDLVQHLIVAGFGIGLLPVDHRVLPGVCLLPLNNPDVTLRAFAVTRRDGERWPPLALVLSLLAAQRA
nr:LysR family transcriptional regulator [Catenulispora pinisilvae]